MSTKRITYQEVADSLANGNWHWGAVLENKTISTHINEQTNDMLTVVLLADIAKSLRVLRCSNFTAIPRKLDRTCLAVEGLRREAKQRARVHRRKL